MSNLLSTALWVAAVVAVAVTTYSFGRRSASLEAADRLYDSSAHLLLSCSNEEVVALTKFREGKSEQAIRELELLVTAKLEQIDVARIPGTIIAKKSLENLRPHLVAYRTKFPATTLDSKKNPRLEDVMGALR